MKKAVFNMEPFTCPSVSRKLRTRSKSGRRANVKVMFNSDACGPSLTRQNQRRCPAGHHVKLGYRSYPKVLTLRHR